MTIHAIRGYVAADSGMSEADIQTVVDDWVAARQKWSSDWDATVQRINTQTDGSGMDYIQFGVRFEWSVDKDNTLQKLADKFKNVVDWFVGLYHKCTADDPGGPGSCEWNEQWRWTAKNVTVPSEIDDEIPDGNTVVSA